MLGPCLDDNDAIQLLLQSDPDPAVVAARAHVDACEPCRALVAELAKLVVDETAAPESPTWVDTVSPGAKIGPYEVIERIGRGSMGSVYLSNDARLNRRVAIKLLDHDLSDASALRRLRAEARSMARLQHPNVVEVLDVGQSPHGPFVAMQYVDGGDLRTWLSGGDHTDAQILGRLLDAGRGLAAAHDSGVVHRDFKPANILVGRSGDVRVADFGLAVLRSPGPPATSPGLAPDARATTSRTATKTEHGAAGTPAYMAPEQLCGGVVGPAADQFAFCVTVYEALAGRRPFPQTTVAARLEAIASRAIDPLPKRVAAHVGRALWRGLSTAPDERFAGMHDLLSALAQPRRRARTLAAPLVATGVIGALWFAFPDRPDDANDPLCDALPQLIPWDGPPRDQLQTHWKAHGIDPATTTRMLGRLDGYALRWEHARRSVCKAEAAQGEPVAQGEPGDAPGRVACLAALQTEFSAFIAEARDAQADRGDAFVAAAGKLRTAQGCLDAPQSDDHAPLRARLSALRSAYLVAEARGALDDLRSLRSDALTLHDDAATAGATPLQARLAQMLGVLDAVLGEYRSGAQWQERAFFLAEASDRPGLAFDCALSRALTINAYLNDPQEASTWTRHAQAKLATLGDDNHRTIRLAVHEASLQLADGDPALAATTLMRAEALLPDPLPADHTPVTLYNSLGQALALQSDHPGCRSAYTKALRHAEAQVGPDHPDLLPTLIGIATCEMDPEFYDDAQRHLERAVALAHERGRVLPEAYARGNLGLMHRNREYPTQSLDELRKSDALLRQLFESEDPRLAHSTLNLSEAYFNAGEYASAASTAAIAVRYYADNPDETFSYNARLGAALAALHLGSSGMAPRFERLVEEAPTDNFRADAVVGLVGALRASGRHAEIVDVAAAQYAQGAPLPAISNLHYAEGWLIFAQALDATGSAEQSRRELERALAFALPHAAHDPRGIVPRIRQAIAR